MLSGLRIPAHTAGTRARTGTPRTEWAAILICRRDASDDRYEFELENQAGSAVRLGEVDRRALVTGLALHEKARRTLAQVFDASCSSKQAQIRVRLDPLHGRGVFNANSSCKQAQIRVRLDPPHGRGVFDASSSCR